MELEKTFTGVVPTCWIIDGSLYWPPMSKASAFLKRKEPPNIKTWSKFKVIKEKLRTDDFKEAQNMLDTSAVETDADDNDTGKRDRKPTTNNDFALLEDYESDTESDDEPQPKRFKAPSDELSNKFFYVVFFCLNFLNILQAIFLLHPLSTTKEVRRRRLPNRKRC